MAILKRSLLKKLKGTIGNVYFRHTNGKCIVSALPGHYTSPGDSESVLRKTRFTIAVKISGMINSLQSLHSIWKMKTPNGSRPYDYIMKNVYPQVTLNDLPGNISLTPVYQFRLQVEENQVFDCGIIIKFNFMPEYLPDYSAKGNSIKAASVIFLSQPDSNKITPYSFFALESAPIEIDPYKDMLFNISFSDTELELIKHYNSRKVLSAGIIYNPNGKPISWSETF